MHPKHAIRVFIAVVLMAGLMGLPAPTSVAGAPVPPPALLAPVDAAHPPQGLSTEEWAGILRQIGQAEDHPSAAALIPSQVKKLTAGDGIAGDASGISVAVSGDTVVVGTYHATVGGNLQRGAAYIYARNRGGAPYVFARNQGGANQWDQIRKLTAGDGAAAHYFGGAVALSGDTAVVGAWGADVSGTLGQGAAYVFARNQGGADQWGQVKKLAAADGAAFDRFGYAVAIDGQADAVVVGAYYANVGGAARQGAAYIFIRNQGGSPDNWGQVKKLVAGDGAANDYFGRAAAISGESVMVGAVGDDTGRGAAYLFARNQDGANVWGQVQKLTAVDGAAGDNFGIAVAINEDAHTFILGAPGDDAWKGAAYVFARQGSNWAQQRKTTASDGAANDQFGSPVSISGDTLVVGADRDDIYKDTVGESGAIAA